MNISYNDINEIDCLADEMTFMSCIDNVDMELVIYVETGRINLFCIFFSDTLNGKVNVISDWDFSGFIYSGVHWIDTSAHATLYKLEVQEGLYCIFFFVNFI